MKCHNCKYWRSMGYNADDEGEVGLCPILGENVATDK